MLQSYVWRNESTLRVGVFRILSDPGFVEHLEDVLTALLRWISSFSHMNHISWSPWNRNRFAAVYVLIVWLNQFSSCEIIERLNFLTVRTSEIEPFRLFPHLSIQAFLD